MGNIQAFICVLFLRLLVEEGGVDHDASNTIGIDVRSRATIFQVSVALCTDVPGNTDRGTTVGNTRAESSNVASLMATSQPEVVILSVNSDVLIVPLGQLGNGSFDVRHSSRLAHRLGAVVGVAASTVPVTSEGLGVERDLDAPLLRNTDEEVTGHPEVVTHGDTLTRADLEFPLGGHNLSVNTADVHAGVEAGAVMGLNEVTGKNFASSGTTIVWALGTGEATLRPAIGGAVDIKQSVLLLKTEPWDFILGEIHGLLGMVTVVGFVRGAVVVVTFGKDEDVVTATEGILEDCGRTQVDIGVVAGSLVGGRTVKIPDAKLADVGDLFAASRGFATEAAITINPNIFGLDFLALGKSEVRS